MPSRHNWVCRLTSTAVGLLAAGCCTTAGLKPPPDKAVHVADLIAAIQRAIDPFWDVKDPPLSSVKVALQTVRDNRISGEVDYLVVAVKGYYDNAATEEVDLTLMPKQPPAQLLALKDAGPDIEKALREAIENARKQISKTYSTHGHILNTQEIDVQISFAVTWDISAGVAAWKISPISISASDEYSKQTTNTITVVFKAPDK
jgi:hypothetical protein